MIGYFESIGNNRNKCCKLFWLFSTMIIPFFINVVVWYGFKVILENVVCISSFEVNPEKPMISNSYVSTKSSYSYIFKMTFSPIKLENSVI